MIVVDNEYYKLEYDASLKISTLTYKKQSPVDVFNDSAEKLIGLIKEKGNYKQITDIKSMDFITKEYVNYSNNEVIPALAKIFSLGNIYIAIVSKDEPYFLFIIQSIIQNAPDNGVIKYFNTIEKAKKWLNLK